MKKVINLSLVLLWVFIGILVVAPQVFAEGEVDTLHLVVYSQEGDPLYNQQITATLGSKTIISFDGIDVSGKEFAFFIHNGKKINEINTEFIFSASTYVVAVFKESNQKVAAFVDTNGQLLDIQYSSGVEEFKPSSSEVSSKAGYSFAGWDLSIGAVIEEDVVIKPVYHKVVTEQVTINVNDGDGTGEYEYNELVTISSDLVNFTHWEDENGFVVSYNNEYKFTAIKDRILTAKTGGTEEPLIYLQDVTGIRDGHESYLGQVYLPEGYELIQNGLLVSDSIVGNFLNFQKIGYEEWQGHGDFASKSIQPITKEFLYSIPKDQEDNIRAYAIIKDSEDNLVYVHSENSKNLVQMEFNIYVGYYDNDHPLPEVLYIKGTLFGDGEGVWDTNYEAIKWHDNERNFTHITYYNWFGKESPYDSQIEFKIYYPEKDRWIPEKNQVVNLNFSVKYNNLDNAGYFKDGWIHMWTNNFLGLGNYK